jgi:hypothetical protein
LPAATGSTTIQPEAVYRNDQGRYVRFSRLEPGFKVPYPTGPFGGRRARPVQRYHL